MRLNSAISYGGLRALGLTALSRRLRDAGLILGYHNVVGAAEATVGSPSLHMPLSQFEQQMRWLADHYDVVSLREFSDRLASGRSLRSLATVTFDDGYTGVFENAIPALAALGLPATVFLVVERVDQTVGFWWDQPEVVAESTIPARRDQWLTELRGDGDAILSASRSAGQAALLPASHRPAPWTTIRACLGGGVDFGVHSATHRAMPTLTDAELQHEVVTSRAKLQRLTGVQPAFFSYPYGHWDTRVRAAVRAAGYRAAVTLDPGLNGPRADLWALRRVNVPAAISESAFDAWTAGLYPPRREPSRWTSQ